MAMLKDANEADPERHGLRSGARSRLLLNVDLEVESQHDLRSLIDELEPFAYSLERPPGRACFELNSAATLDKPELLVLEFVRIVQALSPSGRSAWDRASRRVLDIGFQSALRPFQETHCFAPETLHAVAEVGAELAVTIYASELGSLGGDDDAGPA
jgi:hypothetical protein